MQVENGQTCEEARIGILELTGCGLESCLCRTLKLYDTGQIISILSLSFAIFMSIFILVE